MKKLLLLVALLAPAVPSMIKGIETDETIKDERRAAMLEERFKTYCAANSFDYYSKTNAELNNYYDDFWMETEDYLNAVDSVDSVLSAERRAYILGR